MIPKKKEKNQYLKYVVFSGMAFQMGITIALFTYIGILLDEKFPNDLNIYTVIFSLIGVIGSIYIIVKQVINTSKDEKK